MPVIDAHEFTPPQESITLLEITGRITQLTLGILPQPPSKRTVQRWMQARGIRCKGPTQKFRFYDRREVDKWLAETFPHAVIMDDVDAARAPRRPRKTILCRRARKGGAK